MPMHVLLSAEIIRARVVALAAEISNRHRGQTLTILVVMDGAFVFVADLVRHLSITDIHLHFVRASSYVGTTSSGNVHMGALPDVAGQTVLVVDDILDTGRTLHAVCAHLTSAASVEVCVLLDKPTRRIADAGHHAHYTGFTIPDAFVVGYGLDYNGRYRHLPDIRVLSSD